ncbi:type II secretion system protein N [Piscinibacter sakaiensis]|uniref:type II secretion system protein N n=1 Tax=Piscinibacter sakaiensis TaxID=1547922 RepID=UPI003AAD5CFE
MMRRREMAAADATARSRNWRWAVFGGLVGAVLATVIWAPARWLASAVESASNGRLLLAESRGSIWDGNAIVVLTGGPESRAASALPGRLHWRLRPRLLDGAALAIELEQACCINQQATLLLKPGLGRVGLRLQPASDWIARWPASWLAGLGTPWNTLDLGGQLVLRSNGLTIEEVEGRWRIGGGAELELLDLSSRLSTLPSLGSYRLGLRADPAGAGGALLLSTIDGALRLRADGRWDGAGLRLRGEASAATPGDEAVLGNLLNIIGRRQGARSVISIG